MDYRVITRGEGANLVQFSPDGRWLTAKLDGVGLAAFDAETGALLRTFSTLDGLPRCLGISSDGASVAVGLIDPDAVIICDAKTGQAGPGVPKVWADSLDFSQDGRTLAVGAHGGEVYIFPIKTDGGETVTFGGHPKGYARDVRTTKFVPGGKVLLSASVNGTIRLWDVDKGEELACVQVPQPNETAIAPSGEWFVAACEDGVLRRFSLPDAKTMDESRIADDGLCSVSVSADGRFIACDGGGRQGLCVLDASTMERRFEAPGHVNSYLSFHPHASNVLATACNQFEEEDGGVRIWSLPG
jgi:WD40 repeat protein